MTQSKKSHKEVIETANRILSKDLDLIEGVLILGSQVRSLDEKYRIMEDISIFDFLESELDTVPIGSHIENCSKDYLVRQYKKAGEYIFPQKERLISSCKKLIKILS